MDTSVGVFWNFQDLSRGESWLTALLFQIVICHYHSLILLGVFLALKSICCIYSQSKKWNASRLATIATRIDSYAGGSSTHKLCRLHTAARWDLYYFTNTMNECRPWEITHCLIWGGGSGGRARYIFYRIYQYQKIIRNFLYLKMAPKVAMRIILSTQYHDDPRADIWHHCNHAVVRHGYPKGKVSDSNLILWEFVCLMSI